MSLDLWFLFPLAVLIAVVAMSAGVSGSNFWVPVYMIGLGMEPTLGFWLALLTMLIGFSSGIVRNLIQGTVEWTVARSYLIYALPGAMVGSIAAPYVPASLLIGMFAVFVLLYGAYALLSSLRGLEGERGSSGVRGGRALLAGTLKGLIATGTGKLLLPCIMAHERIRSPGQAVGTTVTVVFLVNLAAVSFRLTPDLIATLSSQAPSVWGIMAFVAPGVVVGGQLGPLISDRLSPRRLRAYVGAVLVLVSLLMGVRALALA